MRKNAAVANSEVGETFDTSMPHTRIRPAMAVMTEDIALCEAKVIDLFILIV